jgi:hypothetical protein
MAVHCECGLVVGLGSAVATISLKLDIPINTIHYFE